MKITNTDVKTRPVFDISPITPRRSGTLRTRYGGQNKEAAPRSSMPQRLVSCYTARVNRCCSCGGTHQREGRERHRSMFREGVTPGLLSPLYR